MSYLRVGSDVDIDLTNDPSLLGANALAQGVSVAQKNLTNMASGALDAATKAAQTKPPARRVPGIRKDVAFGAGQGSAPAGGMRRGYLDPTSVTEVRTAGAPTINKTRWALIVGGALLAGGVAFYALRKRG